MLSTGQILESCDGQVIVAVLTPPREPGFLRCGKSGMVTRPPIPCGLRTGSGGPPDSVRAGRRYLDPDSGLGAAMSTGRRGSTDLRVSSVEGCDSRVRRARPCRLRPGPADLVRSKRERRAPAGPEQRRRQ